MDNHKLNRVIIKKKRRSKLLAKTIVQNCLSTKNFSKKTFPKKTFPKSFATNHKATNKPI